MANNDKLALQEKRCRVYAKEKGVEIVRVYMDEGVLQNDRLLHYLRYMIEDVKKTKLPLAVICDHPHRLASDFDVFMKIETAIRFAGGFIVSPGSSRFGDDVLSIFKEDI